MKRMWHWRCGCGQHGQDLRSYVEAEDDWLEHMRQAHPDDTPYHSVIRSD